MTWTLAPDDRPTPRVATLSSRTATGKVLYPLEFWDHARPVVARNSGDAPCSAEREAAREPASPLSWYDSQIAAWEHWDAPRWFWPTVLVIVTVAFVLAALAAI